MMAQQNKDLPYITVWLQSLNVIFTLSKTITNDWYNIKKE